MRRRYISAWAVLVCLFCTLGLRAQQSDSSASLGTSAPDNTNPPASLQPASGTIPRLIKFTGVVKDLTGKVSTGVVGLTFSLYELPEGGNPLWTETQSLSLDALGRYTALLGANSPEGLPLDLFTSGKALWVGVQPQLPGQPEQPRVLLVAVPYSLKSSDADTLGGLPASAFMLAPNANTAQESGASPLISLPPPCVDGTTARSSAVGLPCPVTPSTPSNAISGGGTANFAAMFTGASTIGNSTIYNSLGGWVGIRTTNPAATLDVHGTGNFAGTLTAAGTMLPATGTATASQGFASNPFDLIASSFNSGTSTAMLQLFRWQAEPAANNTASPSGTLNLLYLAGSGTPAETGLSIASNGQINFASGQTFPGTGAGSVTSVGSGAGLVGGPITTTGTLSIATGGVTNAMLTNSSLSLLPGTALAGGGSVQLGGSVTLNLDTTKVPTLGASTNTFTGSITASSFSGVGSGLTNVNAATLGGSAASAFQPAGNYATLGASNNTFNGSITASSFTGNGAGLTNLTAANLSAGTAGISITGNAATATTAGSATTATTSSNALSLGGVTATDYARLDIGNSFTGNQSVTGNVSATGSVSGGTASFTGALSGTSATFSGALTAGGAVLPATGAATSSKGYNSNPFDLAASAFNGTSAISPDFRWMAEPANNNSSNASATLNLQFSANGGTPGETGVSVASNGIITFAPSQTFPGAGGGTITGVTAGTDLTGGGTSGSVSLNLDTTKVPTLAASGNVFTGSITASAFSGDGTNLTNVNAAKLNGLLSSAFQPAGSYAVTTGVNTFAATQTISSGNLGLGNGNLGLPDTNGAGTAGVVTIAGNPFLHDCCGAANQNGFVGRAGNFTTTGTNNTASGFQALSSNTTGNTNTASGVGALSANTTGNGNTAFGFSAGHYFNGTTFLPATGANSTFVGANATATVDGLSNATAIGYGAQVGESNALVLGSGASVGIGTSTPLYTLDVHGTGNFTGPVTFASGQTFPGAGTVTSVASGAGLTGGPISTSGTLSIGTGGVTNSMMANSSLSVLPGTDLVGGGSVQLGGSVTLNLDTTKVPTLGASSNVFTGSITASSFSGSGANLTGLTPASISAGTAGINISGNAATATSATNAGQLGGVAAASFARLDIANSFTGNQSVTGNVTATGSVSAGAGTFSGTVSATGAQLPTTGTATSSQGFPSNPLDWIASSFNSGTSAAVPQLFRWKAEPAGNNTSSPSGTLNLLYLAGTGTPAETGLSISSNGRVNFASGQTFPGTGTVTSVASGSGLTGGPITGTGTLSIAAGGVTNAMLANPSLTVLAGAGLTGGGSVALGNSVTLNNAGTLGVVAGLGLTSTGGQTPTLAINTNTVPQLSASNTFTQAQNLDTTLNVDFLNANAGAVTPGILFGNPSGEGISSERAAGGNQYGLDFYTNSTRQMSITNTGLVGIGTNAPYTLVHIRKDVSGALGPSLTLMNGAGLVNAGVSIDFDTRNPGSTNPPTARLEVLSDGTQSSNVTFLTKVPGSDTNALVEQMRLTDWGVLDVDSSGTNGGAIDNSQNTGTGLVFGLPGSGEGIASNRTTTPNLDGLDFYTDFTNRLAITNAGNVGIGTTSPAAMLEVNGTAQFDSTVNFASGQTFPGVAVLSTSNAFTGNETVTGKVGIGTTSPGATLDVEGAGGASTTNGQAAGSAPSALKIVAGPGGSSTGGFDNLNGAGGAGGGISLTTGNGGNGGEGGAAGSFALTTGGGGAASLGGGGAGGGITLTAGSGGSGLTAGSGGSITLQPGMSGGILAPNGNVVLAPNGGSVGIATSTPAATLEVNGTAQFDQAVTFLQPITTPTGSFTVNNSSQTLAVTQNGSGAAAVLNTTGSGNILVGQNSGNQKFAVNSSGDVASSGSVTLDSTATNSGALSPGLNFGAGGEGIASKRTTGGNQYGLDFYTNTTNRMSIRNNGLVGIGTTNPYTALHITQNVASNLGPTITLMDPAGGTGAGGSVDFDGYDPGSGSAPAARIKSYDDGNYSADLGFMTKVPGAVTNGIAYRMWISSGGNIGINTTTPSTILEVNGTSKFDNTASFLGSANLNGSLNPDAGGTNNGTVNPGITFGTSSGEGIASKRTSGGNQDGLDFYTNSTPRMSITNSGNVTIPGNVGIGTSPSNALTVFAVGTTAAVIQNSGCNISTDNPWSACAALLVENDENVIYGPVLAGVGSYGLCDIDTSGDLLCSGSKSAVVPVDSGARQVALYAVEAPENWFEDAGSGQLSNGSAIVALEPTFAQTVNTGVEYHVFLTPEGDCEGLYVTHKTGTGFEVHELRGGHSNIAFDFRIMARRKGYESIRLADKTRIMESTRRKRPSAAGVAGPDSSALPAPSADAHVQQPRASAPTAKVQW